LVNVPELVSDAQATFWTLKLPAFVIVPALSMGQ
jgi:hypothetical protein